MVWNGVDFTPVLNALVLALAALIVVMKGPLASYLRSKASGLDNDAATTMRYMVMDVAREAVQMSESIGTNDDEKKALAVKYIERQLAAVGVVLDEEVIDSAVEAALGLLSEPFRKAS